VTLKKKTYIVTDFEQNSERPKCQAQQEIQLKMVKSHLKSHPGEWLVQVFEKHLALPLPRLHRQPQRQQQRPEVLPQSCSKSVKAPHFK
jgi:hypothetical protein